MSVPRFKIRPEIRRARHISECSTSSNIPLHFTKSSYNSNDDDFESRGRSVSQMEVPSPMEPLQMDGLCQNTFENISVAGNLDSFDEKCDSDDTTARLGCTSPSCKKVLFSLLFFMCAFALALSIMMTLQMNLKYSNDSTKDAGRSAGQTEDLLKMLRDNMTKLEKQLQKIIEFKDDFSSFKERIDEQYHSVLENKNIQLENSTNFMEKSSSQINDVQNFFWTTLNNTVDIVKKEFGEYYKDMNNTLAVQEKDILNIKQIQQKSREMVEENHTKIVDNFEKMGKAVEVCIIELNETKDDLYTTNSTLLNEIQMLRLDALNKIHNISKMKGPQGLQGPMGPRGLEGLRGPPGFNVTSMKSPVRTSTARNFSLCQYKNETQEVGGSSTSTDVIEPKDKRIVGATCSTDTAENYRFVYLKYKDGRNRYMCFCRGKTKLNFAPSCSSSHMCCTIHYWECPLVT